MPLSMSWAGTGTVISYSHSIPEPHVTPTRIICVSKRLRVNHQWFREYIGMLFPNMSGMIQSRSVPC